MTNNLISREYKNFNTKYTDILNFIYMNGGENYVVEYKNLLIFMMENKSPNSHSITQKGQKYKQNREERLIKQIQELEKSNLIAVTGSKIKLTKLGEKTLKEMFYDLYKADKLLVKRPRITKQDVYENNLLFTDISNIDLFINRNKKR